MTYKSLHNFKEHENLFECIPLHFFLFMTVSSRSFFSLMSSYLMSLSFFPTRHINLQFLIYSTIGTFCLTELTKVLDGLNAGML